MSGHPAAAMTMTYERLPKHPFASVAVIVKLNVPGAVGVPAMTPAPVNVRPVGRLPLVTAKV